MKKTIAILIICLCFVSAKSQVPSLQWVKGFGGISADQGYSTVSDAAGNIYVMGSYWDIVDMDPGPGVVNLASAGQGDIFISKFDAAGSFLWAKRIGNSFNNLARTMSIDYNGNLYLTGDFLSTLDFDPGPGVFNLTTIGGNYDAFLLKLDPGGNFIWAKKLSDADVASSGWAVSIASSGNIYVAGTFNGTGDFDPGAGSFIMTGVGVFISKFDSNGNFLWSKQRNGGTCYALVLDPMENIYTTGTFYNTTDFDPGPAVFNLTANNTNGPSWSDGYISKLDINGNFVFAKQISGINSDVCWDMAVNLSGEIFVTGSFYDIADFDPGPGTYFLNALSFQDAFVLKLNNAGNFAWAVNFPGSGAFNSNSVGLSIALDAQGNVYTAGAFEGGVDFDPSSSSYVLSTNPSTATNQFISKLTANGVFIFAIKLACDRVMLSVSMIVDPQRNIIMTGYWGGVADFDPGPGIFNLNSNGLPPDVFLLKLNQACIQTTTSTVSATTCNTYTLNGQTYTSSGSYIQTLINTAGCDSILTLNLTINGSNITSNATGCESYIWEGQTYSTTGIYHVTYTDINGCDSTLNLNLVINHAVTTNISVSICEGQSYAGHTTSGTYTDTYIAANGCDSIRILNLVIKPKSISNVSVSICEGQSYAGHTTSGTYTDTYLAANGCDSIRTLNLVVKPKSISTINAVICEGHSYAGHTTSGTYTDTYIAANGCDSVRTLFLTITPRKYTNINASICQGQTYLAGGQQQTISGVYHDTLQTTLGCDSVVITHLVVNPNPSPNLGLDKDLCKGSSINFNPGSFITYQWQDLSSLPIFTATTPGLYWVTVKDIHNCSGTDTVRINKILPLPSNFLKKSDSICLNQNLILRSIKNYTGYNWSNGSSIDNINIQSPGLYWLNVKDINGCLGSDTVRVSLKNCFTGVFIPSAFTPNNDGNNDFFKASVLGKLASFSLEIYDRYGHLIFRTENYQLGWDGSLKGNPYSASTTFVWQCYYQLEGKLPVHQFGTVILLR